MARAKKPRRPAPLSYKMPAAPPVSSSSAPEGPTILSLTNDLLVRIFHLLLPSEEGTSSTNHPRVALDNGPFPCGPDSPSPAAALAATCGRLRDLYRARVVLGVDGRERCVCVLPRALRRHPAARAASAWAILCSPARAEAAIRDVQTHPSTGSRLAALSLRRVPTASFAEALVAAVPELRYLRLDFEAAMHAGGVRRMVRRSSARAVGTPSETDDTLGCLRLLEKLPVGLRSVDAKFNLGAEDGKHDEMLTTLLLSIAALSELSELRVEAWSLPAESLDVMPECHALRAISVLVSSWKPGVPVPNLLAALPLTIRDVSLLCARPSVAVGAIELIPNSRAALARLPELQSLEAAGLSFSDLAILEPVAARLRKLVLSDCVFQGGDVSLSEMTALQVLSLRRVRMPGADALRTLLRASPALFSLTIAPPAPTLHSSYTVTRALESTAAVGSIRALALTAEGVHSGRPHDEGPHGGRGRYVYRGSQVSFMELAAVGKHFAALRELSLCNYRLDDSGRDLDWAGRGCQQITKLTLQNCVSPYKDNIILGTKNFVASFDGKRLWERNLAATIRERFPRIEYLCVLTAAEYQNIRI